jgi:hypothetical protein
VRNTLFVGQSVAVVVDMNSVEVDVNFVVVGMNSVEVDMNSVVVASLNSTNSNPSITKVTTTEIIEVGDGTTVHMGNRDRIHINHNSKRLISYSAKYWSLSVFHKVLEVSLLYLPWDLKFF